MPRFFWMVVGVGFADYYPPQLRLGASAFLTYYAVNMISEHFLFHGVMLAALRRGVRWPSPAKVNTEPACGWNRPLRWIGLAQPIADERGAGRVPQFVEWLLPDRLAERVAHDAETAHTRIDLSPFPARR